MANATSSSTAIVLTENDIRGAALERCKPAKHRRRSLSSLDLVVWQILPVLVGDLAAQRNANIYRSST